MGMFAPTLTSWSHRPVVTYLRHFCIRITCSRKRPRNCPELLSLWWWVLVTTMVLSDGFISLTSAAVAVPQCPLGCTCVAKGTGIVAGIHVNCSHAQLSTVPPKLPGRVELLDLSHNPLRTLTEGYFQPHAYLHTIDLSYCGIQTINNGAFSGLRRVQNLDLHGNGLSDLDPAVLSDLVTLSNLDLSHNKLTSLGADWLLYTRKLKKLKLQHNKLTSLPKITAGIQSSLDSLNLNNNPLKELQISFFKSLRLLTSLHLANTQLYYLPGGAFSAMARLKTLNLAHNRLREINADAISPVLPTLRSLNLAGNPVNCTCVNVDFRELLVERPLAWDPGTAATCSYPPVLLGDMFHQVDLAYFDCDLDPNNITYYANLAAMRDQGPQESPYKSKLGPLHYNPLMGWYTAATLSGMLVMFLLCLALDKVKRGYYKMRRARRMRHEKASYASGSLRISNKGSHNSIDGMDSISMVVVQGNTHNTSFNTSFDTDKDSLTQGRAKSHVSGVATPPLTNDNRAALLRHKYKERRARPDSLSLSLTSQKTYRFPTLPIDTLTNSLEQAETNL